MYLTACFILLADVLFTADCSPENGTVELKLELKTSTRSSLNPRFLSLTVDASLASEPKSQKLMTLTRGLSPAYLRFGGTKSDFLLFDPSKNRSQEENIFWDVQTNKAGNLCDQTLPPDVEHTLRSHWPSQERLILKETFWNKYRNTTITKSTVDLLYRFANCSGLHLIFGLNALLRKGNEWSSSNAKLLIDYCYFKKYNLSWELGNEPNSFRKKSGIYVNGYQLGKDFVSLHDLLSKYPSYKNSGLFGPDTGQPKTKSQNLLRSFLQTGGQTINSVTWHHYYINGRTATIEDFISSNVLDTLAPEIQTVLQVC
ncbi:hypothetical protein GDO86_000825 [Hymenochirus boettgeri]|uniref:Heparanase n=1 Tax=Hymenochirus boettgeri TaxID=247094 RepID=A0A8T2KCC6_9PIPI|nr:hypothetical protein GDO86_000825 [Hymenochirus boettgeri]